MNIHHVLFFCFSSAALSDGNTGLVNAQSNLYTKMEGEDIRIAFHVHVRTGSRKYLCRNDCKKEDILIKTHGNRAKSGRYIIRYDNNDNKVHVVITELTRSDAGWYKVGVTTSSSLGSYREFEIRVRDLCDGGVVFGEPRVYSATEGGNITIKCSLSSHPRNRKFLCREECNKFLIDTNDLIATSDRYKVRYGSSTLFNVTITQLTKSDSGRYRCGVGRQYAENTCQEFEITVTDGNVLPLVVCLTVVVVLLAVCVLLLYKWKTRDVRYVNTRGNGRNTEISTYDDCEGSTYQDLDPYSRDHNLYSSLRM